MNKNKEHIFRATRCFRLADRAMEIACKRMCEGHSARIHLQRAVRLKQLSLVEFGKVEAI